MMCENQRKGTDKNLVLKICNWEKSLKRLQYWILSQHFLSFSSICTADFRNSEQLKTVSGYFHNRSRHQPCFYRNDSKNRNIVQDVLFKITKSIFDTTLKFTILVTTL